jgi:hypothetical protein
MYKVQALDFSIIKGRGIVVVCKSPVSCSRSTKAFQEVTGGIIEIDGHPFKIKGVEMFLPGTPLKIGELIGILV